ncbi:MAG: aspartate aminotransferase family protein [Deltaproteobacteria bacterium]|nr:aspartate aminotransferase family protein [Deltaproteobacteria bacterium]
MAIGMAHGDKRINQAIGRQLDKFAYCHPMLSNQPRAELCQRLSRLAPGDLNTAYLSPGGGSDAIESAIKLARQYHLARGNTEKHMIVSHYDSYHGMSLGALSVAGGAGMRKPYDPMLLKWPKIHQYSNYGRLKDLSPEEWGRRMAQELEEVIHWTGRQYISAFLATPIGCAAEYGLMPPASYWKTIREICAASLAVIDILEKDGLIDNSAKMGDYLHSQKNRLLAHKTIADARGKGLLMVIEIVADKETMDFFSREARAEYWLQSIGLKNGVVFYSTLYGPRMPSMEKRGLPFWIAPPLCITRDQIDELLDAVYTTLSEWEKKMGV